MPNVLSRPFVRHGIVNLSQSYVSQPTTNIMMSLSSSTSSSSASFSMSSHHEHTIENRKKNHSDTVLTTNNRGYSLRHNCNNNYYLSNYSNYFNSNNKNVLCSTVRLKSSRASQYKHRDRFK
eukprot:Awhi_evm1s11245